MTEKAEADAEMDTKQMGMNLVLSEYELWLGK